MTKEMRFAIMGSGAVGGYFGGRLAEAGADVTFIARGPHLDAMRANGLQLESPDGDALVRPVTATDDPAGVGAVDTVLVAVKTWQLADAIEQMRPLVGGSTTVLPLLNGVEASDMLAASLGKGGVLNGLCRVISQIREPGVITHVGAVPTIVPGERDNRPSDRVQAIAVSLRSAGITVDLPDDVDAAVWMKLLFVVSLGGIGAVTRAPMGVVRSMPETRDLLEKSMHEIRAVAVGKGINLPADIVANTLTFLDGLPAEGLTSLHRDVADGRRSELEAWTGAVVRLGKDAGVATPVNEFIYASLLPQERRAQQQ